MNVNTCLSPRRSPAKPPPACSGKAKRTANEPPLLLALLLWLVQWLVSVKPVAVLTWCLCWWGTWGSNPEPTD